jgi:hypothetical protein
VDEAVALVARLHRRPLDGLGAVPERRVIEPNVPTPLEAWNLFDQLVLYAGPRDVRAVMVAGQLLMENGALLRADEPALKAAVHEQAQRLWAA